MADTRSFLGFEFFKAGEFKITNQSHKFKHWESKIIIDLHDEQYKTHKESIYIVMNVDDMLYVGEFIYSFQDRWLGGGNYVNHHRYKDIKECLDKGDGLSIWLATHPYSGELNVSRSLEYQIIKDCKPKWNHRK
jgi:hypothetical protein